MDAEETSALRLRVHLRRTCTYLVSSTTPSRGHLDPRQKFPKVPPRYLRFMYLPTSAYHYLSRYLRSGSLTARLEHSNTRQLAFRTSDSRRDYPSQPLSSTIHTPWPTHMARLALERRGSHHMVPHQVWGHRLVLKQRPGWHSRQQDTRDSSNLLPTCRTSTSTRL